MASRLLQRREQPEPRRGSDLGEPPRCRSPPVWARSNMRPHRQVSRHLTTGCGLRRFCCQRESAKHAWTGGAMPWLGLRRTSGLGRGLASWCRGAQACRDRRPGPITRLRVDVTEGDREVGPQRVHVAPWLLPARPPGHRDRMAQRPQAGLAATGRRLDGHALAPPREPGMPGTRLPGLSWFRHAKGLREPLGGPACALPCWGAGGQSVMYGTASPGWVSATDRAPVCPARLVSGSPRPPAARCSPAAQAHGRRWEGAQRHVDASLEPPPTAP